MNKKGQALVEFILILPIFLMILFCIVDFGMILNTKSQVLSSSTDIIDLLKNNENIDSIKELYPDLDITVTYKDKYYIVNLKDSVDIITPGLNRIMGDPYIIEVERVVPYA